MKSNKEKYKHLNDEAKKFLLYELKRRGHTESELNRCIEEMNILYDEGELFIIMYLFMFKKNNKSTKYLFSGMVNNLLILYKLGINRVDPIKYNLSQELCKMISWAVGFINGSYTEFLNYLEEVVQIETVISDYGLGKYLIIPNSNNLKDSELQAIRNHEAIEKDYVFIWLEDIPNFINNVFESSVFERHVEKLLKPKDFDDYIKIMSLNHATNTWPFEQYKLFRKGIVNIKNLISNREDIYDYLIERGIEKKLAAKISTFIGTEKHYMTKYSKEWDNYRNIMIENNCEEWFVDVCTNLKYLPGRGQAISELLFRLDEKNILNK